MDRLYQHGAVFASEIQQEASPILSFLLGYLLPIGLMILLGNWLARRMMKKMGGDSMMFGGGGGMGGLGKSNAKVYVKSSQGIKFSDVAGED